LITKLEIDSASGRLSPSQTWVSAPASIRVKVDTYYVVRRFQKVMALDMIQ
jgi:hypothetical protein